MSAEMVKTARSRVLTGGAASFGSPESRATPSWCRCQRQSPKDLYRKKHRSRSIHRFSRETGHDFSNGFSFKRINYKETSVIVSLKLKLTTKKCYVLSEKIFFEFRISNFMIYRTIPCLILPRWHRIASLQLWLCTSATQTNEYLYVCNRDAENCHKLPRSMAARLTTSREENVILINRYEADT